MASIPSPVPTPAGQKATATLDVRATTLCGRHELTMVWKKTAHDKLSMKIWGAYLVNYFWLYLVCTCGTYHSDNCDECRRRNTKCKSREEESEEYYSGK